jgi:site-specific recombinase XerC
MPLSRRITEPLDIATQDRNRAILVLMGVHGLRMSEVAGLTLDDVDLYEGVATVLGKGWKGQHVVGPDGPTWGGHGYHAQQKDKSTDLAVLG